MVVALTVPVDFEPLVASAPDQPPDAVQAVALVEDQVNIDEPPLVTLVGLALIETVGVAGAVTLTVADCAAVPPAPVQVSVYLVAAVSAAVFCEPLVARAPLQPPDAAQEVAFVEDQVKVEVAPLATVLGLALKVTVGAGEVTVTVADCVALPPVPVQANVYVALLVRAPMDCDPLIDLLPLHCPDAVQDDALVDDHDRVELLPLAMLLGLALKLTVGAGELTVTVADCAALPPAPVQVRVYVAFAFNAPVECEPLVAWLPDQPPEAVQAVAFVVDQLRVELAPLTTELGFAARLTVGAGAAEVTEMVVA